MQFEPVAKMLEFGIWTSLSRTAAEFLAQCVTKFGKALGPLHWAGTASQTNAKLLLGNQGWASIGCPYQGQEPEVNKQKLITNWTNSGKLKNSDGSRKNIWYDLFPDPQVDPEEFANLCIFKQLWEVDDSRCKGDEVALPMCESDTIYDTARLWHLFDGGLCNVAYLQTQANQSADDLFLLYFGGKPTVPLSCGGSYAAGAVSGATGAASSLLGVAALAPNPAFLVSSVLLTIAGGAAGAIAGGNAAKESCKNKEDQQ